MHTKISSSLTATNIGETKSLSWLLEVIHIFLRRQMLRLSVNCKNTPAMEHVLWHSFPIGLAIYFYTLSYFLKCFNSSSFFIDFLLYIQDEHKFFPWLQIFITRKLPRYVGTLHCTSVRRVSAVDNFRTRWCLHTGFWMFVGFWT